MTKMRPNKLIRTLGTISAAAALLTAGLYCSRASAGAHAHRPGNPDRPARRQAHRTGAIAASRGCRNMRDEAPAGPAPVEK